MNLFTYLWRYFYPRKCEGSVCLPQESWRQISLEEFARRGFCIEGNRPGGKVAFTCTEPPHLCAQHCPRLQAVRESGSPAGIMLNSHMAAIAAEKAQLRNLNSDRTRVDDPDSQIAPAGTLRKGASGADAQPSAIAAEAVNRVENAEAGSDQRDSQGDPLLPLHGADAAAGASDAQAMVFMTLTPQHQTNGTKA